MIKEKERTLFITLIVILIAAVVFSAGASVFAAKSVHDLRVETGLGHMETQEDDVPIMNGEYYIRSTTEISDAYKAGSDSGLDEKQKETLEMASAVLDEIITEDMTPYDKEKAVYDWMSTKLTYDTGVLQVIPQTSADCDNPYGVLKYHNAVCVGYATTFRLFMQMMDIPCMVVHNNDLYHSWNLVQLDGNWYHVDIYSDQGNGNYANFNMNDEMASSSHDWDQDFFPAATSLDYNYAYQNRQPVEDLYQIPKLLRQAAEEKQGILCLDFAVIDEAHAQIVEAMLSGVQSSMDSSEAFQNLWMHWNWMHITGSEYVLAIFIEGYDPEESSEEFEISAEDQLKIEEAVNAAFGEDVDWDSIQGEMAAHDDTAEAAVVEELTDAEG